MKLAGIDLIVWLIIIVVVSIAQGWKKLQEQGGGESSEEETPPPTPRPRPQRPPRPASQPPRPGLPAPPVVGAPADSWRVEQDKLEEYRKRLAEKLRAKVAAPPPLVEVVKPVAPAAPPPAPKRVVRPMPKPRPVSPLIARLRNPRTAREFIIGAEILGPPKGVRG